MVSIRQWPLSMASGWLWQSEADQFRCNARKIQQLRLGDPVPHAVQWHWEKLEALSPGWEHLGESLSERQTQNWVADLWPQPLQVLAQSGEVKVGCGLPEGWSFHFCFLSLCLCPLVLADREKKCEWSPKSGEMGLNPSAPCPTPCRS